MKNKKFLDKTFFIRVYIQTLKSAISYEMRDKNIGLIVFPFYRIQNSIPLPFPQGSDKALDISKMNSSFL